MVKFIRTTECSFIEKIVDPRKVLENTVGRHRIRDVEGTELMSRNENRGNYERS